MPFAVLYDTCVLVPLPLRDLLLRLAESGLVRASLSEGVLDELHEVLQRPKFGLSGAQVTRMREHLERAFPDGPARASYDALVGTQGLPDAKDEHVLAAARIAGVGALVTANLKDFPADVVATYDLEIKHPDEFVLDLVDLYPLRVVRVIEEQAAGLVDPLLSYEEVLDALARSIPQSVARIREL